MSQNRTKYLIKNTAIFTVGNIATKLISFILIPLYTNVLSTFEYGLIDLIVAISTIAAPIVSLNIMEAVMRFNLDKGENSDEITKIGIVVVTIGSVVGLILLPISSFVDLLADWGLLLYLYTMSLVVAQLFLCDLRGKEMLIRYSVGSVMNTLLIAILNIVFLLRYEWGIRGYLWAYIIANCVVAVYSIIVGKGYKAVFCKGINFGKAAKMLKYSVVLIPNSFMWWIMNSLDHFMVTRMVGVEANGIYAVSYKLPTLISTVTGIFNQAWSYSAIKEKNSEDINSYTNSILRFMIGVVMLVGLGMLTVIKPFLSIYVSYEYSVAWKYTPFLVIGCVYATLGTFISTSYTVNKDSKGFLISGLLGAAVNIVLNIILIPYAYVYGAAVATCVSYILVFVYRLIDTQKYIKYNVLTKEFIVGTVALLLSGFLLFIDNVLAQVIQILILLTVFLLSKDIWKPLLNKLINKNR